MDSDKKPADHLDRALGEYRVLERRIQAILQGTGLTVDAWRVLRLLQRNTGVSMKEILDATALPPASATRTVDTLVSFDYSFRRPDDRDRRSVQVLITDEGLQALSTVETLLNEDSIESSR